MLRRHSVTSTRVCVWVHVSTKPLCIKQRLICEAQCMITNNLTGQFVTETWGSVKLPRRQHGLSWHVCRGAPGVHTRTPVHARTNDIIIQTAKSLDSTEKYKAKSTMKRSVFEASMCVCVCVCVCVCIGWTHRHPDTHTHTHWTSSWRIQ